MQDMPMEQTPPSASPSENLLKQICRLASGSSAWMKFLGVLSIIQGIFLIFTIWGILICWLPIWLGVILFKAAGDAEMASKGAATKMTDYLQKLNRYFLIQGILNLIMIIIGLVVFIFAGMAFFAGMLSNIQ